MQYSKNVHTFKVNLNQESLNTNTLKLLHNILCLLQDMYQYVLSKDVDPPFSLSVPHPRSVLECGTGSIVPYKDTLIFVEADSAPLDLMVLEGFSESNVNEIMSMQLAVNDIFIQPLFMCRNLNQRVIVMWTTIVFLLPKRVQVMNPYCC